jgi:hypothetical protein
MRTHVTNFSQSDILAFWVIMTTAGKQLMYAGVGVSKTQNPAYGNVGLIQQFVNMSVHTGQFAALEML